MALIAVFTHSAAHPPRKLTLPLHTSHTVQNISYLSVSVVESLPREEERGGRQLV